MRRINAILKHMHLLNIILMVILVLMVGKIAHLSFFSRTDYREPRKGTSVTTSPADSETKDADSPVFLLMDYNVVTENNLFHPNRTVAETATQTNETAIKEVPDFILYGIVAADRIKIAYMEDRKSPVSSPGRGKRQVVVKAGESISGYVVEEIDHDRVVMTRGDERITVLLNDPMNAKEREASKAPPASKPKPAKKPLSKKNSLSAF